MRRRAYENHPRKVSTKGSRVVPFSLPKWPHWGYLVCDSHQVAGRVRDLVGKGHRVLGAFRNYDEAFAKAWAVEDDKARRCSSCKRGKGTWRCSLCCERELLDRQNGAEQVIAAIDGAA